MKYMQNKDNTVSSSWGKHKKDLMAESEWGREKD